MIKLGFVFLNRVCVFECFSVLEAMSGLASDSFEASSRAAYETLIKERIYPSSPQDFLSKVSGFNKSLESLLVILEDKIGRYTLMCQTCV